MKYRQGNQRELVTAFFFHCDDDDDVFAYSSRNGALLSAFILSVPLYCIDAFKEKTCCQQVSGLAAGELAIDFLQPSEYAVANRFAENLCCCL